MVETQTGKEKDVSDFVAFLKKDYGYKHVLIVDDVPDNIMAICVTHNDSTYMVVGNRMERSKAFFSVHLPATKR